jgi:hypothetical protein
VPNSVISLILPKYHWQNIRFYGSDDGSESGSEKWQREWQCWCHDSGGLCKLLNYKWLVSWTALIVCGQKPINNSLEGQSPAAQCHYCTAQAISIVANWCLRQGLWHLVTWESELCCAYHSVLVSSDMLKEMHGLTFEQSALVTPLVVVNGVKKGEF